VTAEDSSSHQDSEIGPRIRQRREELGLSLRELARRTELSPAFISRIENGQVSTSISSLRKIADELDVPMLRFLREIPQSSPVLKKKDRPTLNIAGSKVAYELLVPDLSRKVEVFKGCLGPGAGNIAAPILRTSPTENFIYVLAGKLSIGIKGVDYILEAEDTIYFNGPDLTQISNGSKTEQAEWIAMITPPAF
jgi:transcriptional regulator with XRE-family HTH domain